MRTVLCVLYVAIMLTFSMPYAFYVWLVSRKDPYRAAEIANRVARWAFRCLTVIAGVKLHVEGEENIPADRSVVYMANHRSFFDVILTGTRLQRPTGYLAKKEIGQVPLLGVWMKLIHCGFVDRKDVRQGLKVVLAMIEDVKKGYSIFIFPEGTRSKGDEKELLPFHDASFKVAVKPGAPVVPVAISGSRQILEAHFPWVRSGEVTIKYGEPIDTASLSREEQKELSLRVRENIINMLSE